MRLSFTLLISADVLCVLAPFTPAEADHTPVVKEDDCWQPQRETSLAPRLRQKADPVDASLQDSDWLSLSHVYIPEPITATRTSLGQLIPLWSGRV